MIGINFELGVDAFGHCVGYCTAGSSQLVPPQQEISPIVWEVLAIGGVVGGWIIIFGLFKEDSVTK